MNIEEQDEIETKEWEEALSLVESIFKEFKENSPDSDKPTKDLLDVSRWKVVWGKKPAQYRLKPFLMWSVDEMPSIPEECESFSATNKPKEINEILKIKKDKQLGFLKSKMFKLKRRIDQIDVVLAKTLSDETAANSREEDPTKAARILQLGARKVELVKERKGVRDKLKELSKQLILFEGSHPEIKQLLSQRQDVGDAPASSGFIGAEVDELAPNRTAPQAGEPWSFKNGRRLAIKKEVRSSWSKPGSAQAKDAPRSSSDLGDRRTKKKRHHKKRELALGIPGETDNLGRQTLSESYLNTGVKDQGEQTQQQRVQAIEGAEKIKNELRTSRSSEIHKELTTDRAVGSAKHRLSSGKGGQEISSISRRGYKTRRDGVSEGAALKNDGVSSPTGSKSQLKSELKADVRTVRSATDLGAEGLLSPDTAKTWKPKRSNSSKEIRAVKTTHSHSKSTENKDFIAKPGPGKPLKT